MGNKKYDPLIFGTVNIVEQVKVCGGLMYLVTQDNWTHDVIIQCSTCGAIKKLSYISYLSGTTEPPQQRICGATICQE
jgi:hypothetical protein